MNVTHEDADACESDHTKENAPVLQTVTASARDIPHVRESSTPGIEESI